MILGIVGSEEAKFTQETKEQACNEITHLFEIFRPHLVVSGECHLGGVDIYVKNLATEAGIPYEGHKPKILTWANGYKPRNLLIAEHSDVVACITVRDYHKDYYGMKFNDSSGLPFCYHCGTHEPRHVKSGGCWTVKQARRMGKQGMVIIVG